jgi:hypothetical protein
MSVKTRVVDVANNDRRWTVQAINSGATPAQAPEDGVDGDAREEG